MDIPKLLRFHGDHSPLYHSSGVWKTDLIALRRLDGEHTGENMAALLLEVFREYKIGGCIGFLS